MSKHSTISRGESIPEYRGHTQHSISENRKWMFRELAIISFLVKKKIKHSSDCTAEMTVLIINLQSQLKNQEEEKSC